MADITRLNDLYSATTQSKWQRCGSDLLVGEEAPNITDEQVCANSDWVAESHNAWPAVAAELARLREFAQRVREASRFRDDISVAGAVLKSIDWLAETEKVGEP